MFHVRGKLCISERTGLFVRCRGKVKNRRKKAKAKRRSSSSRARAPRRSSARKGSCKVFALYQGKQGMEYRCAQFKATKKRKHAPSFVPGTEVTAAQYKQMLRLPGFTRVRTGPGAGGATRAQQVAAAQAARAFVGPSQNAPTLFAPRAGSSDVVPGGATPFLYDESLFDPKA